MSWYFRVASSFVFSGGSVVVGAGADGRALAGERGDRRTGVVGIGPSVAVLCELAV